MRELDSTTAASEPAWQSHLKTVAAAGQRRRADLGTHDHAALIYWEGKEFLDALVPYLIEGLDKGERVVHVGHEMPTSTLAAALEDAGVDVSGAVAAGRLMLLAAKDAFFADGRFDTEQALAGVRRLAEQAQADGVPQVRFSVDLTYLLAEVPGMEDGLAFEARANEEIFERFPFVCICSYNASHGANHVVEDILATHPVVFVQGFPLTNPYYRPWKELSAEGRRLDRWKQHYGLKPNG